MLILPQAGWQANKLGLVAERTAVFLGILQLGLHSFVKHAAAIVLRSDKYARSVRPTLRCARWACGLRLCSRVCSDHVQECMGAERLRV
jgi:hypothetical protein